MTLIAKTYRNGICVEDTDGGVWWPDEETAAKIEAAEDPEAEAVRLCQNGGTGEWKS